MPRLDYQAGKQPFFELPPSVGHLGGFNIAITKNAFDASFDVLESSIHRIYDVLGYGIFGNAVEGKSKSITDGKIEWIDMTTEPRGWPSFDVFIRYALCRPGHKTLLIQTITSATQNFSQEEIDPKYSDIKSKVPLRKEIAKLEINGSMPLTTDITFESVRQVLDSHTGHWYAVTFDIATEINSKEARDNALDALQRKISMGNNSLPVFSREGSPLINIAPGQVLGHGNHK